MNNLSSYCGLTDARMKASEKYLSVKIHTVSKYSFLITKQLTSLYVVIAFRTLPFACKGLEKNILIHRLGRLKRVSYICSAVHYKESTRRKLIGRLMMLSYIIKSTKF